MWFQFFLATTNYFAFEDPNLYTDHTVSGVSFVVVVDVGTQGVQWHTTFAIPFSTCDFSTAETTAHLDFDAFGTMRMAFCTARFIARRNITRRSSC